MGALPRAADAAAAAGPLALLLHQLLESLVVDAEPALGDQLAGQVVGEAVGVVELEGVLGGDPRGAGGERVGDQPVEELAAAVEGAAEALLLGADPAHDRLPLRRQRRVDGGEQLDRPLGEAAEVGRFEAEDAALVDGPAHDPPQHVAAALVRGDDAVADQLDRAADVVGDDPHRPGRGGIVAAVGPPGELDREVDERAQQVGVEDRVDVLLDRRQPLEPEAGVDVLRRQLAERPVLVEVVGGEDEVPVLEEAIGVVAGPIGGAAERLAAVDVELRGGPARALAARLPEVLRARQHHDPLLGDAALLPDLDRLGVGAEAELLVAAEHGHPDRVRVEAEAVQRQLPGEVDRLLLEVVAEGEVAEHLEAGQMPGGAPDLLDVGRPEAALAGRQPRRRRRLAAEEVGLKRLHPGGREQHAGVVGGGDQRRRGHAQVAALLEERHVGLADLLRFHRRSSVSRRSWRRGLRTPVNPRLAAAPAGTIVA